MNRMRFAQRMCWLGLSVFALIACQTAITPPDAQRRETLAQQPAAKFQQDRQAILAMAGNYDVTFDFLETVSFLKGYEPKERYVSGGYEVVRVIEDTGDHISLQHILVVGGPDEVFPIKHWRQDWQYEPKQVLAFIGGNAWEMRQVPAEKQAGSWSQTVYQVDDSPRYGAVAAWSHENGVSEWVPSAQWRPLPRRDMTKRSDYHTVLAVNRHAITPQGWVHEQDNSKLVLSGDTPQLLVREVGVNTYTRFDAFEVEVAEDYWEGTADYWAAVRRAWSNLEASQPAFGLTLKGEAEALYLPLLEWAGAYLEGALSLEEATRQADEIIHRYTTADIGELRQRLRGPRSHERQYDRPEGS